MIDPSTVLTTAQRRLNSSLRRTQSETTLASRSNINAVPSSPDELDSDQDESPLTLSPADIRTMRRLFTRCNVLPVVSKADTLTDERLQAVRQAGLFSFPFVVMISDAATVRDSMAQAGLDFGVFESSSSTKKQGEPKHDSITFENSTDNNGDGSHLSDEDEERKSRPVIKLRPARNSVGKTLSRSRSRSRRDIHTATDEITPPDTQDPESLTSVRFAGDVLSKIQLNHLLPFAIIAPEATSRRPQTDNPESSYPSPKSPADYPLPDTPASTANPQLPYLAGSPESLKGVFTRKFRWGTIDVLDPSHCDFAALRTTIFSTHFQVRRMPALLHTS
jgi:hypothetical protein